MATQQVNGSAVTGNYRSGGSTKNNNGVAVNAGSPTSKVAKVGLGRSQVATGSVVVDRETTNKSVSAGAFGYSTQKPIGARLPVVVGASSSNVLLGLANVPSQISSIHKIQFRRVVRKATAMRAGRFNFITGKFTVDPTSAIDTFGTDVAASPTRNAPGQLVYKLGKNRPVSTTYKAVTNIINNSGGGGGGGGGPGPGIG